MSFRSVTHALAISGLVGAGIGGGAALAVAQGRVEILWGDLEAVSGGFRTRGGLATMGRNPGRSFALAADVAIPAAAGYGHAGIVAGYQNLDGANPDVSPALLAVLHGGDGQCFVSIFDGLTNGREIRRVNTRSCSGRLELSVDGSGIAHAAFDGSRLISYNPGRSVRGEIGLRGGQAQEQHVSFRNLEGFDGVDIDVLWGGIDGANGSYATDGGLGILGINPASGFALSARVEIPARNGYGHAGLVAGYELLDATNPDVSPALLAVLHGGDGQCFVSLFDGLTNGREVQRVNVATCGGRLQLRVTRSGRAVVLFEGASLIQYDAGRDLRGEFGIRGGQAQQRNVSFRNVRLD